MGAGRKIVYEFEHADTLARLKQKITVRTRNGWKVSGEPRELATTSGDCLFGVRYCQSFYRYSNEPITAEPWLERGLHAAPRA